jgi:hypothetical protein
VAVSNPRDFGRGGVQAIGWARAFLDRKAATIARMNEQLSALALALAIIVTLTAVCRAPTYWADRSPAQSVEE